MKQRHSLLIVVILLIIVSALYRVWDGRPFGFAPQLAMAIFGGAVIKNKRLALVLPLLSMLLSDALYQVLYLNGLTTIKGFYGGQWINYILFAGLTVFGFALRRISVPNVALFSVSGSLLFFLLSNFTVWLGGGGYGHPKTAEGLMLTYVDGLAFYRDYGVFQGFWGNLFVGDLFFCGLLFGAFALLQKWTAASKQQLA